jgi:ligand-binding sensor domain-containing protein
MTKLFTFLLVTGVCLQCLNAQEWVRTGIVDSTISVTGGKGGIWAATQNNGLQFLDTATGQLKIYNTENTDFITNDFRSVMITGDSIYAGTFDAGFYLITNTTLEHYDANNSLLPGMLVADIILYDKQTVFFATDKGLVKKTGNEWTVYDSLNSEIAANKLTCLYIDKDSTLWIGTRFNGVSTLKDDVFTNYNYNNAGLNDNWVRAIASDKNGLMYIADYLGVNTYDTESDFWLFVYNTFTAPMSSERVNKIGFQSNGTLWFATHIGVTSADTSNFWSQYYSDNSNLPHNTTDGLYIDENDRVWIATYGGVAVFSMKENLPMYPNQLVIAPNPCSSELTISSINFDSLIIYDAMGHNITNLLTIRETLGESIITINVSALSRGVYFIYTPENGSTASFIKL